MTDILSQLEQRVQQANSKQVASSDCLNQDTASRLIVGQTVNIGSTPVRLNQLYPKEGAIKITNLGTTELFYGTDSSVNSTNGDLIPAGRGNWVSVPTNAIIWICTAPGQSGSASWAVVYE